MNVNRSFTTADFKNVAGGALMLLKPSGEPELGIRLMHNDVLMLSDFAIASLADLPVGMLQGVTLKYSHTDVDEFYSFIPSARPGSLLVTQSGACLGANAGGLSLSSRVWIDLSSGAVLQRGGQDPVAMVNRWRIVRPAPIEEDEEVLFDFDAAKLKSREG